MPDTRTHRGPDPEDERLFGPDMHPRLRQATSDLSWLLTRGYAIRSATELVGNRYSLETRQRLAIARCACSDGSVARRKALLKHPETLRGEEIWIDGLNVLTGIEVALAGGIILIGRDECCRDIAGIHRHYRKVEETSSALRLLADLTSSWGVTQCRWWLDKPVSNTGRLKQMIQEVAGELGRQWEVELVNSPDAVLSRATQVIATADSVILDRCQRWVNLVGAVIAQRIPQARCIDLSLRDLSDVIAPLPDLSKSDNDERDQRELH